MLLQGFEEGLESNIFVIVNLLNSLECPVTDRLAIAELNLKAAKRAAEISAFESCVSFGERGIALLSSESWSQQQKLTLELYSLCSEAHFSVGNIDEMYSYVDEIIQQETLTELEKGRAYHCKISTLGGSGKASEALALSLDVLGRLGCKFPRTSVGQVAKALSSLSSTKLPKHDITALSHMIDSTKKACMMLMTHAATYAHYCNNPFAMIMAVARMVRWTIKHGIDVSSAAAFALFGSVKVKLFGEYKLGAQFADLGLKILTSLEDKTPESRVTYIVWFMVAPRSRPIHSTLKHLLRGYKVGMQVGDAESAMWNVSMYICSSIVAGKSLKALAADCKTYLGQMIALNQDEIYTQSLPFWQGVLNLLGDAKDPLHLTGTAMDEQDYLVKIEQMQSSIQSYAHLQIFKSMMCSFFGDFETGAKLALERGDSYGKTNGSPLVMLDFLHQGISLYAMARMTERKKYANAARKITATFSLWAKKGNVNVAHYIPFLKAEEAALKGKSDDATHLYMAAISWAARSGFQHNAALASERFGEYLLYDLKDEGRARSYFLDAAKYYSDWGSDYKSQLLQEKYSHLLNTMCDLIE